jgi:hypothetical protein
MFCERIFNFRGNNTESINTTDNTTNIDNTSGSTNIVTE